jgi:alcohol dehydrogenase class IV
VDGIIAIGGGSALDTGKAIAALVPNPGTVLDYLEIIGQGRTLEKPPLPWIAIPTTAGTGAETTRNAVLASPEHGLKVSLRSPLLLPQLALVDPELSYQLPPLLTATTGLDALTQLIEPFVSCRANPLTDALCREGLRRIATALPTSCAAATRLATLPDPTLTQPEKIARADMALAATFSGMALANAGLGAVHGFAGTIGGQFPVPHGAVCAALLPHVMTVNLAALRHRDPANPALGRFTEIAQLLCDQPDATPEAGIAWIQQICQECAIPNLAACGVQPQHFDDLTQKASRASSMKGNPIPLHPAELTEILTRAS